MQAWLRIVVAGIVVLSVSGCERDEIRAYPAPKEAGPAAAGGTTAPSNETSEPQGEPIRWTLPEGWRQLPGQGMRYATLAVESGDDPLEVRVTPLGLVARDPLANVNRWREQIGLEPIGPDALATVMRSIDIDGHTAHLIDMVGPAGGSGARQQVLSAILAAEERVWFFLIMGPPERVAPHAAEFEQFVSSIRLPPSSAPDPADVAGLPPGHPPVQDAPADVPASGADTAKPTWTLPPGWQEQPGTSRFRVATFRVTGAGHTAEVAVTRFPGDVGGLLANVNRWRDQVGLAPVRALEEQPIDHLEIDGNPAGLLDLIAPGAGADSEAARARKRMFVVLVSRPDMTWFLKMTGPEPLLEKQKDAFDAFVHSVRFAGGSSG
ncbi:MAG: hypothetical protein ACE5G2_00230 [Candidatus Krumholzibacteriia bacterium]